MELDARLCSDSLLKDFFNEYLQLNVWPVALQYDQDTGSISECCLATDQAHRLRRENPSIRSNLLDWAQQRRWDTFLRSRLYCEYRLCSTLNGATPTSPDKLVVINATSSHRRRSSRSLTKTSGRPVRERSSHLETANVDTSDGCLTASTGCLRRTESVLSAALPDDLWSDGEESVAMETAVEDESSSQGLSSSHFYKLKSTLNRTVGATLIDLWVDMEAWQLFGESGWVDLRTIRKIYYSTLHTDRGKCGRVIMMEGDSWMVDAQKDCVQKLVSYWLPRFNSTNILSLSLPPISCGAEFESPDPSLLFVHGLRCNAMAGTPFQEYLIRERRCGVLNKLEVWEACDKILSRQFSSSNQQILRGCWTVWTVLHRHLDSKVCSDNSSTPLELNNVFEHAAARLWHALQNTDADRAKVIVQQLEGEMLGDLKRLWTKFLREDYDFYLKSMRLQKGTSGDRQENLEPPKRITKRRAKKKRKKSVAIFDLQGTPLEPLQDHETVALFEQFLLSECGEGSDEELNYHLWRAVTLCLTQKNKEKRDAMALAIQQKYIYTDSDKHVDLIGSSLELVDSLQEVERPSTPALLGIQSAAAKSLTKTVERYLIETGELRDTVGSVASMDYQPKVSLSNKETGYCVRNEIRHFSNTLDQISSGPISHQLKSFSSYLEEHAPLSQRKTLLNNVQFWLEVKKFNNMYESGTNMQVLLSKGEALIDRYLDTITPPWVKVTVPAELAVQVVSAAADLAKVKVPNHVFRLNDLLGRCQRMVFLDMVPYWGRFCQQYKPPDGSAISLPPVNSCHPSRGGTSGQASQSLLRLPPLQKRNRTPLLSYSKLKGVQWKFAVNLD